ncbi:MAG TPA: 5'-3' exonuclease H3TH domain-containing protein, partial [Xanthobacteraceae bacterium]|nr:5'-3' exonuclease H3TH domain-containing protein [Xanthobacteraceae bacterium]
MPSSPKPRPPQSGDHVFLVDGSSYIFRAYHALPPLNRKSDGLQVNAVLGFCNMLWKLLRDMKPEERPTHLAVIFDKSEHTFRNEFYPAYKAHRPDAPDDLVPQFKYIREAVRAFDIPCLEQAGFEADDLIATYAREACEAGATTTIVSSDKDLMQLVGDTVVMYDTMKDRRIGRAEVIERFGVGPEKVIEVQALIGDSTDNVPGVPGIGVKTAAQLIAEYGDLETVLARAGEIKQEKRRQSLIDFAEQARISKKLVTLDSNVPLETPLAELAVHEPDYRRLIAFLKAMEFTTLTRRVADASRIDPAKIDSDVRLRAETAFAAADEARGAAAAAPGGGTVAARQAPLTRPATPADLSPLGRGKKEFTAIPKALAAARAEAARNAKVDRSQYETVRSLDRLESWIERATATGLAAIRVETTSVDPMQGELVGLALAVQPNEACYVPLAHRQAAGDGALFRPDPLPDQIPVEAALDALRPLLEDASVLKLGYDLKFAWLVLALRD